MIDKRMLVDTVTIKKLTGETDVWGKVTYDEPTTLGHSTLAGQLTIVANQSPVLYSSIRNIAQWCSMRVLKTA